MADQPEQHPPTSTSAAWASVSASLAWDLAIAAGLYLLVVAIYLLSGPGRIGMIDGQFRFEVARSLLDVGLPVLRDPDLPSDYALQGVPGLVCTYGAAVSVLSVPILWVGRLLGMQSMDAQQTVFSFVSGMFGAAIVPVEYGLHRALAVGRRSAVGWALVTGLCTLLWVTSTTVFDQPMHALWILIVVGATWLAGRRKVLDSTGLAYAAVAGAALALLVNHQEVYAALLPCVLLALWPQPGRPLRRPLWPQPGRRLLVLTGVICGGLALGALAWAGWNVWRLGAVLRSGKAEGGYNVGTNPLMAALALLLSPGKGLLWYSPPILLGIAGMAGLWRRARGLALSVLATATALLVLYSLQPFFSGDWCWGPRYLVPSLVLLGVAMPFARLPRPVVLAVVGCGLGVQLLGLSLDHHRFFQDRGLVGAVTDTDPGYYWHASALAARPGELAVSLHGLPAEVERFASHPYKDRVTFMTWGLAPPNGVRVQRQSAVFWLPRPWPLWMRWLPPEQRPVPVQEISSALGLVAVLGAGLILLGLRREEPQPRRRLP